MDEGFLTFLGHRSVVEADGTEQPRSTMLQKLPSPDQIEALAKLVLASTLLLVLIIECAKFILSVLSG